MTTKDYTANVISATKVVPDGNFKDSKASGVWDINEALDLIKGGNWPNAANINPAAFVDGLFSIDVWDGSGSARSITNDIDLSTKEGLVWIKKRNGSAQHTLQDTVRGATKHIRSSGDSSESTEAQTITAFNSNGFSLGTDDLVNASSSEYVGWTFRSQPKFFDVVTYTGNGTAGRTISHSLGSVPGMIMVKRLSSSGNWAVYHRGADSSAPEDYYFQLNSTSARIDNTGTWNDTAPTSSVFTVGDGTTVNLNGQTYVAYLFAHNNDDGGFGEPGDQDIIKCGSYTGNGSSTGTVVTLGFEPQFIMLKRTDNNENANWYVFDSMRGILNDGDDPYLYWNTAAAEVAGNALKITPTGFQLKTSSSGFNGSSATYIYMAIRRGGMQTPSTPSDVFHIQSQSNADSYSVGFPTDLVLLNKTGGSSSNSYVGSRLLGNDKYLVTSSRAAEASSSNLWTFDGATTKNDFDQGASTSSAWVGWHWARARGYFDVVTWNVDGTGAQTINHNLGVAPEMIWSKNLDDSGSGSGDWWIGHTGLTGWDGANENDRHALKFTTAASAQQGYHKNLTATSMQLGGNAVGGYNTSHQGIAYLFATVAGVSKVGSFSHTNGSATDVDCGFSNGAKLVICKRTNDTGGWYIFDTAQGIVAGNDPHLELNSVGSQVTGFDVIDPLSSGFTIASGFLSSGTYIFYAIANDPS